MRGAQAAALLCSAVSVGDLALLRRLLHAGAHPNTGDYDGRTALHIAAADCNLPVVRGLQRHVCFALAQHAACGCWL